MTRKLRAMPNVDERPELVLSHLLERGGVIREPVPGRVDFVHRTFQEYLAAREATEEEHIDTLVSHAHLDAWRETITDLDSDVHHRVEAMITKRLVPPRSTHEIRSLAGIGHRLLRYLPESLDGLSEAAAAATVRAAALTNNAEAIPRLARYAQDQRRAVQDEVAAAWQYFDPERYAEEVLADMPLPDGRLIVRAKRLLP